MPFNPDQFNPAVREEIQEQVILAIGMLNSVDNMFATIYAQLADKTTPISAESSAEIVEILQDQSIDMAKFRAVTGAKSDIELTAMIAMLVEYEQTSAKDIAANFAYQAYFGGCDIFDGSVTPAERPEVTPDNTAEKLKEALSRFTPEDSRIFSTTEDLAELEAMIMTMANASPEELAEQITQSNDFLSQLAGNDELLANLRDANIEDAPEELRELTRQILQVFPKELIETILGSGAFEELNSLFASSSDSVEQDDRE